jgi:hypothetical protein
MQLNKIMMRSAFVTALFVAMGVHARAEPIDITFYGFGGTVQYRGGAGPLTGRNIGMGLLTASNTPLNSGKAYVVVDDNGWGIGELNFTTGDLVSYTDSVWNFAGGGSFTITGAVLGTDIEYKTLLNGNLLGASVDLLTNKIALTVTNGTDTKDQELVRLFGLDPNTVNFAFSGGMLLSMLTRGAGNAFTAIAGPTQIVNTVVPEPASIALLGGVLWLIGSQLRRRLS